jgi:Uma2 family endonuclease
MTTEQPILHPRFQMTEDEFVKWATTEIRAEWVDGEVVVLDPVTFEHSETVSWLITIMGLHAAKHDLGTLGGPRFMVRLASSRRVPDLLFITKPREFILKSTHAEGAPDLIVEVASQDTSVADHRDKFMEYRVAGVREYWIIDPASANTEFYLLDHDAYLRMPIIDGILRSNILVGFWFKVEWLWVRPMPSEYEIAKIIGIF